jgi:hypothetical protein
MATTATGKLAAEAEDNEVWMTTEWVRDDGQQTTTNHLV